jgi:hypothetical protein
MLPKSGDEDKVAEYYNSLQQRALGGSLEETSYTVLLLVETPTFFGSSGTGG